MTQHPARPTQGQRKRARWTRRRTYESQALPLGGQIGTGMTMPPSPLDPGVGSLGSGETSPQGAFYDPAREGAPETYLYPGQAMEPGPVGP